MGNEDLMEYIAKSSYRFLYKKNRLHEIEKAILNFMKKKLPGLIKDKDRIEAFKELKTELEAVLKDSVMKKELGYFDFISWLESKIENRPFAEIVKEKVKQNILKANQTRSSRTNE